MSKGDTQYIPSRVIRVMSYPCRDVDAEYTMIVDPDSRSVELGLTPPIHAVCDNCWKPAEMESCGWTDPRGEGTLCCFCGASTENGKYVAYWALNALCENKHSKHIGNSG
jgi:hypothetical protein